MAGTPHPGLRTQLARMRDALAVLGALAYLFAGFTLVYVGLPLRYAVAVLAAPLAAGAVVALRRAPLSRAQAVALATVALAGSALVVAILVVTRWELAAAIPALAVAAVACTRFPAASMAAVALVTASFGSTQAFFDFPSQKAVDLLLIGLWLGALWGWVVRSRHRGSGPLWPGMALLLAFVLLTAASILLAENTVAGLQSFRASVWYVAVVVLIAFAPWPERVRPALLRGTIGVALAAGGYATLRWAIGPAGAEADQAGLVANNYLDGELRPVGSFYTTKELAAWMAMAIPFAAGMALSARGRWRAVAALACGACIVAMLAADVRAGPAAAVPGVLVAVLLYQLAQSFRGRRGPAVPIAVIATALAGAGAFALTLGESQDSGARYRAILEPTDDPSYQARLIKWRAAIRDIEDAPFGHGLGTSGRAQQRYGKLVNVGSIDVDNSYLKIAHEQGFAVLGLFAVAIALLFGGLARRAVTTLDPARAGPALAACGTLVAMLILFWVGTYIEGLPALWGWIVVGLGVSQFTARRPSPDAAPASAGAPADRTAASGAAAGEAAPAPRASFGPPGTSARYSRGPYA